MAQVIRDELYQSEAGLEHQLSASKIECTQQEVSKQALEQQQAELRQRCLSLTSSEFVYDSSTHVVDGDISCTTRRLIPALTERERPVVLVHP